MRYLIISLFFGLSAYAGKDIGNGGDAVVCRDASGVVTSIDLLDLFEAKQYASSIPEFKRTFNLGASNLSHEEKILIVKERFSKLSGLANEIFDGLYQEFMSNAMFLKGVTLEDAPDSAHVFIPAGCQLEQLALQKDPAFLGDKRYKINDDLWSLLDTDQQVGLILHEMFYTRFLKKKRPTSVSEMDSTKTRLFVGLLVSEEFEDHSSQEMYQLFLAHDIKTMVFQGITINVVAEYAPYGDVFHPNGSLRYAKAVMNSDAFIFGSVRKIKGMVEFHDNGQLATVELLAPAEITVDYLGHLNTVYTRGRIFLHPNGTLKKATLDKNSNPTKGKLTLNFGQMSFTIDCLNPFVDPHTENRHVPLGGSITESVEFWPNGMFHRGCRLTQPLEVQIGGKTVKVGVNSMLSLWEDGQLKEGTFATTEVITLPSGQRIATGPNSELDYFNANQFDQNGNPIQIVFDGENVITFSFGSLKIRKGVIELDSQFNIIKIRSRSEFHTVRLTVQGKRILSRLGMLGGGSIELFPGGELRSFYLQGSAALQTTRGEIEVYHDGDRIFLNESGMVLFGGY